MNEFWWFLTDFGDSAVTLPLAMAIALALLAGRRLRMAALWVLCVGGAATATGGIKLLMKACHGPFAATPLVAPSGHTAMSMTVYGGLALLVARHLPGWRGRLAMAAALLLVPAIGLSRVMIGAHTAAEVAAGLAVGGLALAALYGLAPRQDPFALPLVWLAAALAAILAVSYGDHWPIEDLLRDLALVLRGHLSACG